MRGTPRSRLALEGGLRTAKFRRRRIRLPRGVLRTLGFGRVYRLRDRLHDLDLDLAWQFGVLLRRDTVAPGGGREKILRGAGQFLAGLRVELGRRGGVVDPPGDDEPPGHLRPGVSGGVGVLRLAGRLV